MPEGSAAEGDDQLTEVRVENPTPKRRAQRLWRADVQPTPTLAALFGTAKALFEKALSRVPRRRRPLPYKSSCFPR